jgi:hypothetical protein
MKKFHMNGYFPSVQLFVIMEVMVPRLQDLNMEYQLLLFLFILTKHFGEIVLLK